MRSSLALRWLMGLVMAGALLSPMRLAWADGGTGDWHQVVDGYRVELVFEADPTPAVVPVRVRLTDAEGHPVTDARVQVVQNLISAAESGGHDAGEADSHGESEGEAHADAGDDHETAADHSETSAAHGEAETTDAHTGSGAHGDAEAHAEPGADSHNESVAHTHDDSSLFQLVWDDGASAYTSSVIFFKAGQWAVHVEFTVDGQEHVAEFAVEVAPPDPGRAVLAAFAGLNAVVLGTAAVLKRKSAAA